MLERGVHFLQDTSDKLTFSDKPTGTLYKNKANSPQQKSGLGPTDLWHQGCNGKGRKGTVAAPEMTGDLLNAALSWGSAFFIMNFNAFLSKKCPFTLVIPHEGTSGGGINSVALFQRSLLQVLSTVIPDTVSKLLKANSRT